MFEVLDLQIANRWTMLIARIFGKKITSIEGNYICVARFYRGKAYIIHAKQVVRQ